MPLPFMGCGVGHVLMPDPIVANWANITFTAPTTEGTNADIALNFNAGPVSRSIYASKSIAKGTLYYRINSGSWVSHIVGSGDGTPFTFTKGQTVGWRYELSSGVNNEVVTVRDALRGDIIDTFTITRD